MDETEALKGPTPTPWKAEHDEKLDPPWGVLASGEDCLVELVAATHGRRAEADAKRIAAAVNAVDGVPTDALDRNVLGRLWTHAGTLCDLLEGWQAPVDDQAAYRAHILAETRALLRSLSPPAGPAPEPKPKARKSRARKGG